MGVSEKVFEAANRRGMQTKAAFPAAITVRKGLTLISTSNSTPCAPPWSMTLPTIAGLAISTMP